MGAEVIASLPVTRVPAVPIDDGWSRFDMPRLPEQLTPFFNRQFGEAWDVYDLSDQGLNNGDITEQSLERIIRATREADKTSSPFCCQVLAQSIRNYIISRDPNYERLESISRGDLSSDDNAIFTAYDNLWGSNSELIDLDIDSFIDHILIVVNQDPNNPGIDQIKLNGSEFGVQSALHQIQNIIAIVAHLAVDNRINAETLCRVVRFTQESIRNLTQSKLEQLEKAVQGEMALI